VLWVTDQAEDDLARAPAVTTLVDQARDDTGTPADKKLIRLLEVSES
jgi:hypothetical protein